MTRRMETSPTARKQDSTLSLYHLLDPEVLANPYPLYHRLRSEDPVHWDPFLHAWVATRYTDVMTVFQHFSAERTPTPEQLTALGLTALTPLAEVIANTIVTMVGGQETTTNLIGNGILTLLRHPDALEQLKADQSLILSAVEELLRYESPSQHTARLAPEDVVLGGKLIRKRQAVIAVMGAANRDPEHFSDPDRLDICRQNNRHLAFAWASHFCFGAPLARIEGQVAFETALRRMPELKLEPGPITWRANLGLRGLTTLPVTF